MKKILQNTSLIFLLAMLIRLAGVLTCGDFTGTFNRLHEGKPEEQLNLIFSVNNDELLIAEVAINHRHGLSYSSSLEPHREGYIYDFTAYRPTYPVYLHMVLQKAWINLTGVNEIEWNRKDPYFLWFGGVIQLISFLLFCLSLPYFRKIALRMVSEPMANLSVLAYAFHPSVWLYVGNLTNYESITTSLLIINVFLLMEGIRRPLSIKETVIFMTGFIAGVQFRPQLIFIYFFLFATYTWIALKNRKKRIDVYKKSFQLLSACLLIYLLANAPVFIKNHRLFGSYTLSTPGFNFSLGHNPYARGGWCGDCFTNPQSPFYSFIRREIPQYDQLNEYEKSAHLNEVAVNWIKQHPLDELELVLRKVAIYFLPHNSDHEKINLFNLIFNLGAIIFIVYTVYCFVFRKDYRDEYWLKMAPLWGSLLVTIIFHVGYRWRYYAEPFMVISTIILIENFLNGKFISLTDAKGEKATVDDN